MNSFPRWTLVIVGASVGLVAGIFVSGSPTQGQGPVLQQPAVPRELTSYRDIVKKVLPGVVSIEARSSSRPGGRGGLEGVSPEFRKYFNQPNTVPAPTPTPENGSLGFGSGFIVDPAGVILTNYHVVEGAAELEIQTSDGRKYTSRDFRFDRPSDLAIVRIQPTQPLSAMEFGDSDQMEIGDRVLALGAPFGLKGSVTQGIISGKSRTIRLNVFEDMLQTDAAVNPGNSGGPLVNLDGKVIGITSAIKTRSGGFQGVGLALTSNHARTILNQLIKDGVVRRGFIGIIVDDIDPDTRERLGIRGAVVKRVLPNSPASKVGVVVGDIVTRLAGRELKDSRDLQRIVADLPIDQVAELEVNRKGQILNFRVTTIAHPDADTQRK